MVVSESLLQHGSRTSEYGSSLLVLSQEVHNRLLQTVEMGVHQAGLNVHPGMSGDARREGEGEGEGENVKNHKC